MNQLRGHTEELQFIRWFSGTEDFVSPDNSSKTNMKVLMGETQKLLMSEWNTEVTAPVQVKFPITNMFWPSVTDTRW